MKLKTLLGAFFILWTPQSWAMSLNDVTILIPLPSISEVPLMLGPAETGTQGPLLSKKIFLSLIQLVPEVSNDVIWKDSLKVVGVRLDPCFVEGTGPIACRRQIRLVWQPVHFMEYSVQTRDAAVHSFYDFDESTFTQLLTDWRKLSSGSESDALQVHPRIKQEGLSGPYWTYLKQLLLRYCGERNLTRMTAMNVMGGEQLWIFTGVDIEAGRTKPLQIPRIGRPSQGVIQSSSESQSFTGGMKPEPLDDQDFSQLVSDSHTTKATFSEQELKALMGKVQDYENPEKNNPGTLDCASCHLANTAHQWGKLNFKNWDWKNDFKDHAYQSSWNLTKAGEGPLRTNQLRAFGYFIAFPAISQRVVNETAAVAEALNGQLLK